MRDWEIFGSPGRGNYLPYSFFVVRTETKDGLVDSRVIEARIAGPHERSHGYYPGALAGLPRFATATLTGTYPTATVDFDEPTLPLSVRLDAFTPLIPLETDDSSLPIAVMRYTVTNHSTTHVTTAIAGSLFNAVGFDGYELFFDPHQRGTPHNEYRQQGGLRGILMTSDLLRDDRGFGSMAITTPDPAGSAKRAWLAGAGWDGAQDFWNEFTATGALTLESEPAGKSGPLSAPTSAQIGSLVIEHEIEPGGTRQFEFMLSWHFPNRPRGWEGHIIKDEPFVNETIQTHYGLRFSDAWHVAERTHAELPRLERATRLFVDTLYGGSLPFAIVDAISAGLATARSTTCFRLADGTFLAWEGTFDTRGSCEGTCTHVWNYAQTIAYLWPELERSARRLEFLTETADDGRMSFRANRVFGGKSWQMLPAVDGQLGTVVRLYREWLATGDDEFLREVWPAAQRTLEYAFTAWDSDGDLVLDAAQHNTYDIEFYGASSLGNSVFYAALHAAARMASHLGEHAAGQRYLTAAIEGAATMDALLWNGEYYLQAIEDADEYRYQYGTGCLADQVFGQFLAHLVGLGHVLPPKHAEQAVLSVYRNNFRTSLSDHASVQRTFALNQEGGLLLCTWPLGGRPRLPFPYSDEVWTGVEYQVAAHLAFEGHLTLALSIVQAVRDRHDGFVRDPWNDVECGNHYARSMASWALLPAFNGFHYEAPNRLLVLSPRDGATSSLFTTGHAWGRLETTSARARLTVLGGGLEIDRLRIPGAADAVVAFNGSIYRLDRDGAVMLESAAFAEGETLEISWRSGKGEGT